MQIDITKDLACTHKQQKGKWSTKHQQRLTLSISLSDLQFRPAWFFSVFYKVPPAFAFRALNPAWVLVIHYNLLLLFFNQIYDSIIHSKCNFQMHLHVLAGHPKATYHKYKADTFGLKITMNVWPAVNSILHETLKCKWLYWPLHLLVVLSRIAFADWILPYLSTTKYVLLLNNIKIHNSQFFIFRAVHKKSLSAKFKGSK